MDLALVARTSGKEKSTGQSIEAQVEELRAAVEARGHRVVAVFDADEGVSGDSDPFERAGLRAAVALAKETGCGLAFREFARFSRAYPPKAMTWFDRLGAMGIRVLCVPDPEFTTLETPADELGAEPAPMLASMRFMRALFGWSYLVDTRKGTQRAMDGIADGTRKTKSGARPGRPSVVDKVTAEERAWCEAELAKGRPLTRVHKELLDRRGFHDVVKAEAKKKRAISYDTLARALGRYGSSKREVPQNPEAPGSSAVSGKRPDVRRDANGR